jgi:hypothetical protein
MLTIRDDKGNHLTLQGERLISETADWQEQELDKGAHEIIICPEDAAVLLRALHWHGGEPYQDDYIAPKGEGSKYARIIAQLEACATCDTAAPPWVFDDLLKEAKEQEARRSGAK